MTSDILWHNATSNETQIWFMGGNRITRRATVIDENGSPIFIGSPWSIVGAGDFSGDGNADILWHNATSNETQNWFMGGNRITRRATVIDENGSPIFIGSPWSIVGASDFDIRSDAQITSPVSSGEPAASAESSGA